MFSRHDISDDQAESLQHLLPPGQVGKHGGVGKGTRLFIKDIRFLAKTGDNGTGSLRQAIHNTNVFAGTATINFSITCSNVKSARYWRY